MTLNPRRVSTTLPLEIDGAKQPAGFVLTLPALQAQRMVDEKRATFVPDEAPAAPASKQDAAAGPVTK